MLAWFLIQISLLACYLTVVLVLLDTNTTASAVCLFLFEVDFVFFTVECSEMSFICFYRNSYLVFPIYSARCGSVCIDNGDVQRKDVVCHVKQ